MNTARLIDYSSSDEEVADKSACQTDDRKKKDTDKRKDKKLLEDELKRIEREKAEEEYDRWKLKEDEFLKKQLIEQSKIRIENRREEPIDYFMKIIFIYKGELKMDDGINVELMRHPKKIVDRLNKTETESLLEKCDVYKKLEKIDDFKAFWDHIQALALYHQERLIKYELKKRGNISIQTAISDEYNEDVESILKGKSNKQLTDLEDQAKTFLNSADLNVDIEFWDQVLNRVQVQKAVMGLEMIHSKHREKLTLDPTNPTDSNPQNGNKQETEGRNNSGMNEFVRSDPLSPRLYKGDDFGASVRIFTEDDYKRRIDTLRGKCYQNELTLLTKQAQKELELRKMKDIGNVNDLNEVSEEEDEGELTEEARRFKEIMKSAENKVEDDEIAFDDIEQTKKVVNIYIVERLDR